MSPPSAVIASSGDPCLSGGETSSYARESGSRAARMPWVVKGRAGPVTVPRGVGGDDAVVVGGVGREAFDRGGAGDVGGAGPDGGGRGAGPMRRPAFGVGGGVVFEVVVGEEPVRIEFGFEGGSGG